MCASSSFDLCLPETFIMNSVEKDSRRNHQNICYDCFEIIFFFCFWGEWVVDEIVIIGWSRI